MRKAFSLKHLANPFAQKGNQVCKSATKRKSENKLPMGKPFIIKGNRGGEACVVGDFACECLNKSDNPHPFLSLLSSISSQPYHLSKPSTLIQSPYTILNRSTRILLYLSLLLCLLLLVIVSLSLYHIHTPELRPFDKLTPISHED